MPGVSRRCLSLASCPLPEALPVLLNPPPPPGEAPNRGTPADPANSMAAQVCRSHGLRYEMRVELSDGGFGDTPTRAVGQNWPGPDNLGSVGPGPSVRR
jgi:hypothetical protein